MPFGATAKTVLARLLRLRSLEAAEREAGAIRTWPIDTGILSRFAAFVVGVTVLLVAQLIFERLGLT